MNPQQTYPHGTFINLNRLNFRCDWFFKFHCNTFLHLSTRFFFLYFSVIYDQRVSRSALWEKLNKKLFWSIQVYSLFTKAIRYEKNNNCFNVFDLNRQIDVKGIGRYSNQFITKCPMGILLLNHANRLNNYLIIEKYSINFISAEN